MVTVIVPCFNEEAVLPSLLERLSVLVSPRGWQALFVDDGSTDGTARILEAAASRYPWVTVIRHSRNLGLGAALRTGFAAAGTPVVCTMDCDCTYPPERLPELVDALALGADLVTASPWHPGNNQAEGSRLRIGLSRGVSHAYRCLTGASVHTYTSLFRAYRREVIRQVSFASSGFSALAEILVRSILAGYRVKETPMPLESRRDGVSKMKPWPAIRDHVKLLGLTGFWFATRRRGRRVERERGEKLE